MKARLIKEITVDYQLEITPQEIAQLFWSLPSDGQAQFFNELASISDALPMQLEYVRQDPTLTPKGLQAMRMIGEYGGNQ
jgi:hypothetical protein